MESLLKYNIIALLLLCISNSCTFSQSNKTFEIEGINFEAPSTSVNTATFAPIEKLGANWISIMPYGYTRNGNPDIQFNSKWQWRGEREEGIVESIHAAKANQLKIMMKPHLWIHSQFTGNVTFKTEEEWEIWEDSYAKYVLFYAELSEKYKVEMFCIGTELKEFIKERPQFWNQLITDVRKKYSGKLTYAANWDNYDKISFWSSLDYIGVDAYFPISEMKTPTLKNLIKGWQRWWSAIEKVSAKNQKNVIFTEIGYRSIDYCAKTPWVSYEDLGAENQEAQMETLKSFFETAKNIDYFKGAFLWKWHCSEHLPKEGNKKYTFQNKKAYQVVVEYY